MIQQPGNTDLLKEPVIGKFRLAFLEIFKAIEEYHEKLGFPKKTENISMLLEQHRHFCLAINNEVTELCDAVPWKPWREETYKDVDKLNIAEELIDIIFFLGSIRKTWGLSPSAMADILERKLIENERRISIGYNKANKEMGNG